MTIIFYDIPTRSGVPISPNTWKTRYCLNFKAISYKTQWVEQPDIEDLCIKRGILPTGKTSDGGAHFTLPAIYDPSAGIYLAGSWEIAVYLERTYPNTPKLFPNNSDALQLAFTNAYPGMISALVQFVIPGMTDALNPRSAMHFRQSIEKRRGKAIEDILPKGEEAIVEWEKYKDSLGKVDAWYAASGGPFLMGGVPIWSDFVVAAYFMWQRRVWGKDSERWKDVSSWHEGRWNDLLARLKHLKTVL